MATTRNATVMLNKRCRVWHHLPGEWSVELTGDGYPKGLFVSDERLVELVQSDGWALDDPKHLVDLYGPAALREEYQDVARLDADAAGYGYRAGGPDSGDRGAGYEDYGEDVVVYLQEEG
jgi:hypothetical protein